MADHDERYMQGLIDERNRCMNLAEVLIFHLVLSDHPDARTWAETLGWFRKRIKGGQLSILVQQDFDEKFGLVQCPAAVSPKPDTPETPDA